MSSSTSTATPVPTCAFKENTVSPPATKCAPYQSLAEIYDYVMRHVDYDEWAGFIRDVFARHDPEANASRASGSS